MGNKNYARRQFFKKFTQVTEEEVSTETKSIARDPFFEKYARKQTGNRHYSEDISTTPDTGTTANRVGNVTSNLTPYAGSWTEAEVTHLLRRVGYGVRKADVDIYLASTMDNAVDALLTIPAGSPVSPSATPLNYYNATYLDSSGVLLGNDWTGTNLTFVTGSNDGSVEYTRQLSLAAWSWALALKEGTNIREKMVNFWYHFIPVNFDDVRGRVNNSSTANHQYMKLLRDNALGNYNALIRAIAKTPAMLVYLSNQYSTANAPNENFARELMELFMLGKSPTQNYTEDDIKAAAKVLSGWRVTSFTAAFPFAVTFNAQFHSPGSKVFSSFFATAPLTQTTIYNQTGANEFDLFFNMLFSYQDTTIAQYICRRLYRYFVYYDIDANVETNIIAPLATLFINSNWEILPVIKKLLKSQHFYDMANRGVMIKSPLDMIAGVIRTLGVETNVTTGPANQYAIWNSLQSKANAMEQALGLVPNVSGWKAYYQEPSFHQNWINTNTIQLRASFLNTLMLANGYSAGGLAIKVNVFAAVQQFPNATVRLPDALINSLVTYLLPLDVDTAFKTALKTTNLLGGQTSDHYWTDAWDYYVTPPGTATAAQITTNTNTVKNRLSAVLSALLQLAEFQLM